MENVMAIFDQYAMQDPRTQYPKAQGKADDQKDQPHHTPSAVLRVAPIGPRTIHDAASSVRFVVDADAPEDVLPVLG